MIDDRVRAEMIFYATTHDYSDAARYERFALDCTLDRKALEIGGVINNLSAHISSSGKPLAILETASATGLTAAGVTTQLARFGITHTYTSLDIEPNLLQYAKERGRGDVFVRGDFERLPFAADAFDIYIMMGAGGYRTDGMFYPEVHRVLRVGGYYVMPQIGPNPFANTSEIHTALQSGLSIVRADHYLIAQKSIVIVPSPTP